MDKTRRPAACAGKSVAKAGNSSLIASAANATLPDLRKRRRSIMTRNYKGRQCLAHPHDWVGRLRNRIADLEPALDGKLEPHHRFLLKPRAARTERSV